MQKKIAKLPVYFALVIIITAAMILTGCSSGSTSSTPASTSTTQPAAQTQQSTTTGQQGSQQSGQQDGRQGGQDRQATQTKLLARVAELLGVSSDKLTAAYETAMKSVMGDKAPSGSGTQGTPPSGASQGTPPQPPSDNRTGGGPGGQGGGKGGPDMSGVYAQIATELGLTTEKVTEAFETAQKELMPAQPTSK